MSKIQELKSEIKRIEEEESELLKNKYQHLVGKCLHRAFTSYEKVTNICYVSTDDAGEEVTFDCIYVYFDKRGGDYNSSANISLDTYGHVSEGDIERYIVNQEEFNNAFESCVELIRKKTFN